MCKKKGTAKAGNIDCYLLKNGWKKHQNKEQFLFRVAAKRILFYFNFVFIIILNSFFSLLF